MIEMVVTWKASRISLTVHSPWLLRAFGVVSKEQLLCAGSFHSENYIWNLHAKQRFLQWRKAPIGAVVCSFLSIWRVWFAPNMSHGDRDAESIRILPAIWICRDIAHFPTTAENPSSHLSWQIIRDFLNCYSQATLKSQAQILNQVRVKYKQGWNWGGKMKLEP